MLTHWSRIVPNMSTDIRGHEALRHHHHHHYGMPFLPQEQCQLCLRQNCLYVLVLVLFSIVIVVCFSQLEKPAAS